MAGYYDYVLSVIPVVMVLPIVSAAVFGLSVQLAVIVGGAGALPVLGHAMFVRGPDGDSTVDSTTETPTAAPPTAD